MVRKERCPHCEQFVAVLKSGLLKQHRLPPFRMHGATVVRQAGLCPGGGQKPKEADGDG